MGLSSSKAHPKVTKVAPMRAGEDLPALTAPCRLGVPREPSLHPPAAVEWGKPMFHQQLPPLRETWYGRASAGPLSFNTVLEKGETSIIKQHPPRRPQRLEPAGPPRAIAPAKPWSQQEVAASPKTKALEKRGQSLRHLPGRRQHLHKLQMLDLTRRRREAELKRNLHREAKINKQKIKEFSPKKVLDSPQRGDSAESRDLVPAEHNQRFHGDDRGWSWSLPGGTQGWTAGSRSHRWVHHCVVPRQNVPGHDDPGANDQLKSSAGVKQGGLQKSSSTAPGNTWDRGLSRQHDGSELSPGKSRKVDLWFCRESRTRDLFWDTSSTEGSEEWEREEKKFYRKPTLVRTKTERVSLFDDFFDKDF